MGRQSGRLEAMFNNELVFRSFLHKIHVLALKRLLIYWAKKSMGMMDQVCSYHGGSDCPHGQLDTA